MRVNRRGRCLIVLLLPMVLPACTTTSRDLTATKPSRSSMASFPLRAKGGGSVLAKATNTPANSVKSTKAKKPTSPIGSKELVLVSKEIPLNLGDAKPSEEPELLAAHATSGDHEPEIDRDTAELTLARLEEIALEHNPSLQQLAAVVEKARGIHEQSGLYPNPIVGYSASEVGNEGKAGQQGGFISQTIVTGNKLQLTRDVASWNIEEMSWEYQSQRHRVQNDVRLRFYEVLGAHKRLRIADDLLKVARQGVAIAEQLFKAKEASRIDVLQASVDLNEIRIVRQNAQYGYEAAWKRLTTVIGQPVMEPRRLVGEIGGAVAGWEWDATYQKLLSDSPQLQALRARVHSASLSIRRQEAQPIPNVLAQASVQRDFNTKDTVTGIQLGIPLPIFNKNQGNIRLAEAEYHRAVRDVERMELQLRDRLTVVLRNYQQASYQVGLYEKEILANAKENLKLTEETYKAGQVNFLRVLTARRTYFEANLRYVEALIALRKADVAIGGFVLTGGLADVPDIGSRPFGGPGNRGQALSGQ